MRKHKLPLSFSLKSIAPVLFLSMFVLATLQNTSFHIQNYVSNQNKQISGGDITIESAYSIEKNNPEIIEALDISKNTYSEIIETNSIIFDKAKQLSAFTSLKVVDNAYPLYGEVILENVPYSPLNENEIYIDKNIAEILQVQKEDSIFIGNTLFEIRDIIVKDAQSQFSLNFGRNVILSTDGFNRTGIDENKSRIEYTILVKVENQNGVTSFKKSLEQYIKGNSIEISEEDSSSGTSRLLNNIQFFLLYIILFGFFIGMLGIFIQIQNNIVQKMHTYSLLIALGMSRKKLILKIVQNIYTQSLIVIVSAIIIAQILIWAVIPVINNLLTANIEYILNPLLIGEQLLAGLISIFISIFLPCIQLNSLSPSSLLKNNIQLQQLNRKQFLFASICIFFLSVVLTVAITKSIIQGIIIILSVIVIITLFLLITSIILKALPNIRSYGTLQMTNIFIKKNVRFSLVVITTLTILSFIFSSIILLQTNLLQTTNQFIENNAPNIILIDIQKDQKDTLLGISSTQIDVFPVIRSRITSIDNTIISRDNESINGELFREFNITFRDSLAENEKLTQGKWWEENTEKLFVSVEKDSARRFGINIGSQITFDIQGIPLTFEVKSIRNIETDTGMPFFYFVMPTKSLEDAPFSYFGFASVPEESSLDFQKNISEAFPNITAINTTEFQTIIRDTAIQIRNTLYVISLLFYVLGFFLIVALFQSIVQKRKRFAALLRMIGISKNNLRLFFSGQIFAYICIGFFWGLLLSIIAVWNINIWVFDKPEFYFSFYTFITFILFLILFSILSYMYDSKIVKTSPKVLLRND